jgi:hypothetical protein
VDQAAHLRAQAEELRQLADTLVGEADLKEWVALLNLAAEFDALADQCD